MWTGLCLIVLGVVFFLWRTAGINHEKSIDAEKFGQFGDFVGGLVGSVWAFAGIILFYVALKDQQQDIKINRKALEQQINEFRAQTDEAKETRAVMIAQSKTLNIQQFESTFFSSLTLLNSIIQSITYIVPPLNALIADSYPYDTTQKYLGRDSFKYFYFDLGKEYRYLVRDYVVNQLKQSYSTSGSYVIPIDKQQEFANSAYLEFFKSHQSHVGHYFRTMYNIMRFIKDKSPENRKYYSNLVRSQLSTYEHLLLFYNCHSDYGKERFKPLLEEFSMLDNMEKSELLDNDHLNFFSKTAYK